MAKKIGCYIYTGDGIGEALDIDKLVEVATGAGLEIVRTHADLYSPEGAAMVKQDIDNEGVDAVVIAGISPRYEFEILDFPGIIVEKASLRELVTWSHPVNADDENADAQKEHVQELAEDYIRMAVVKVQKSEPVEPFKTEEINQRLLVIGGGVTGLTAALEAAEAGHESVLVERQAELGGWGAKLRKQVPVGPGYSELINPVVQDLIDRANASDKITVKTNTEVARIGNAPGDFRVSLKETGSKSEWDAPFPLTEEEMVDDSGKELSAEDQKKKYEEKNEGRKEYMEEDSGAEVCGAVILASG